MHLTVHEEKRYKMYIVKKKNTYIHWWGKIIVLISNDEYYKLNDLETYLVQKIMRNNNSINVINSISNELEVDTCEAEEFVSIFLNNYDSIFEYKLDIENPIIRINTAFKGCSSLEKISVLPRIYHN